MTATPGAVNGWAPEGLYTQLPSGAVVPAQASATAGLGQILTYDSSGNAALNDGTVPGLICAGVASPAKLSASSSTAGNAFISVWTGYGSGPASSALTNDAFLASDVCTVAWIASENTIGKRSNISAVSRSMFGLVFGIDERSIPRAWGGPVAQAVARSIHVSDNVVLGQHQYAVDAGAATDLTEVIFSSPRAKIHGLITSIEFIPNATLAADATNYKTLTVTKYASDGTTPVVVGTMTTVLVTTKWVAKSFTLSAVAGALTILEGDIFTIQNSHAATGAITPAGVIRINGKAL